jgi:hypothetical protein
MTVTANFANGESLTWEDGAVTGSPIAAQALDEQTGTVSTTPEGPTFDASEWRTSAYAFLAAAEALDHGVRVECLGVPSLARPAGTF